MHTSIKPHPTLPQYATVIYTETQISSSILKDFEVLLLNYSNISQCEVFAPPFTLRILLGLFDPENGVDKIHRHFGFLSTDYMASYPNPS
jgi:hypothetical protein